MLQQNRPFRFNFAPSCLAEYARLGLRYLAGLNTARACNRLAMSGERTTAGRGAAWVTGVGLAVAFTQSVCAETLSLDCRYDTPGVAEEFRTFHVDVNDTSATVTAPRDIHKIYENKKAYPHDMHFRKNEFEINFGDINSETWMAFETTINRRTRQFTETMHTNLRTTPEIKTYSGSCTAAEGPKF